MTPTPLTVELVGVVRIELTPVPAGLPVVVGDATVETDLNGQFAVVVDRDTTISISSGLAAIAITPIVGLGEELAANPPLDVPGYRMVGPGPTPPCKVLLGAEELVVWPYVNSTEETLEVPLSLNNFNNMLSPNGEAIPETMFPPGSNSFLRPLSQFSSGSLRAGTWNFLGRVVTLPDPVPVCTDSGDEGGCAPLESTSLNAPFNAAQTIVTDLMEDVVKADRAGKWRSGGQRNPFSAKGAATLAEIRRTLRQVQPTGSTSYVCEAGALAPASCREFDFPRNSLRKTMAGFFNMKPPKGLQYLLAPSRVKRSLSRFEKSLERMPKKYWRCE